MDRFSNNPSWLDERVRSYMEQRTPRNRESNRARWIGPGETAVVAGYEIPNAIAYVGDRLSSVENWFGGTEPSLINPKLRIGHAENSHRANPLGYRMSYANISQESRAAYLEWLADGRRDPNIGVDYLRLFLFGIERRIIHDLHQNFDSPDDATLKAELIALRDELTDLAKRYEHYTDTATQMFELASVTRTMLGDYTAPTGPPPKSSARWDTPEDLRYSLGCFAYCQAPVPADWALRWLQSSPAARFRTPSKRVPEEFSRLWSVRYRQAFGDGIIPTSDVFYALQYRPDTWSMLGIFDFPTRLPDVAKDSTLVDQLQTVADACEEELDSYSRYIGKNLDAATGLGARALLPAELIDANDQSVAGLKAFLETSTGGKPLAVINGRALVEMWNPGGAQLTKTDSTALVNVLAALGYGLVPDARYDGKALGAQAAVLFHAESAKDNPGPDYPVIQAFVQLAVHVLAAKGTLSSDDNVRLQAAVSQLFPDSHNARIPAFILWLEATGATLTGIKPRLREIADAQKIGDALIEVAVPGSNVAPKTMAALSKAFDALGLADDRLFSNVHGRSSMAGRPATNRSSGSAGFDIDMSRVHHTMAESERVSDLLGEIFDEEETALPAINSAPTVDLVEGLDAAHSSLLRSLAAKADWSAAEVGKLTSSLNLLPSGALDTLNEVAFDRIGDPVVEGDTDVSVDLSVAQELLD